MGSNENSQGNACVTIADAIGWHFGIYDHKPEDFS